MNDAEIQKTIENWKDTLLAQKGITGIARGVGSEKVIVYVEKHTPETAAVIPRELDGIPVEVKTTGEKLRILQARTDRWRPIIGGISLGHPEVTAGTYSGVVLDTRTNQPAILSCNHVCFDDKTEILTIDGWKKFEGLTAEDHVATIDSNFNLEYQKPLAIQKLRYEGKMIHFENPHYDLLVTPDHRLFCFWKEYDGEPRPRDKGRRLGKKRYGFWRAEDVYERVMRRSGASLIGFVTHLKWNCTSQSIFSLPEVEYARGGDYNVRERLDLDLWCEFLGYYLAEGSSTIREKTKHYIVQIRNKNPKLLSRVHTLFQKLGFNPFYGKWAVRVTNKQLCLYLKQFGKAKDKFIPREIKQLTPRRLRILFDAYIAGDGTRVKKSPHRTEFVVASTRSKKLADDLQEIALKLGECGLIRERHGYDKKSTWMKPEGVYYTISFRRVEIEPQIRKKYVHLEDYEGWVYDCTVPNGTLLVRRNGVPMISGNCALNWGELRLGQAGDNTLQPGPFDGGKDPEDKVGELDRWVDVDPAPAENLVDIALARMTLPEGSLQGAIDIEAASYSAEPRVGMKCVKSGRTTGTTSSTIEAVGAVIDIDGWGSARFVDQIIFRPPLGTGGDSGSLVAEAQTKRAIGVLFAGSSQVTAVNRASNIEQHGIKFIGPPAPEPTIPAAAPIAARAFPYIGPLATAAILAALCL
jgi:hypothetical protein